MFGYYLPSKKSFLETTSTQNMVLYQQLVNVNILYIVNLLIHNLYHLNSYCLDWTGYEIIFDFVWIILECKIQMFLRLSLVAYN